MTTLFAQEKTGEKKHRISIPHSLLTAKIRHIFKQFEVEVVTTSRHEQLTTLLGSAKDKKSKNEVSGIYKITCTQCPKTYIGQTKRLITTRFTEHVKEAEVTLKKRRNHNSVKSSIAKHILDEGHVITEDNLFLLKAVNKFYKLDAHESLSISRQPAEIRLNTDLGNSYSPLMETINSRYTRMHSQRQTPPLTPRL